MPSSLSPIRLSLFPFPPKVRLSSLCIEKLSPVISNSYALNFAQLFFFQSLPHSPGGGVPQFLCTNNFKNIGDKDHAISQSV